MSPTRCALLLCSLIVPAVARAMPEEFDGSIGISVAAHNGLCSNHIYMAGSEAMREKGSPHCG